MLRYGLNSDSCVRSDCVICLILVKLSRLHILMLMVQTDFLLLFFIQCTSIQPAAAFQGRGKHNMHGPLHPILETFSWYDQNLSVQSSDTIPTAIFLAIIKRKLKSVNVCYHWVQILLSSGLLSKNITIRIYRTVIFPVVLYGCVRPGLSN